jgi:ketosteroid isomerase-like protein
MSQESVLLARRGYEALAAGDLEGVLALIDKEVEVEVHTGRPDLPETEILRGHAGFLENIRQLTEVFEDIRIAPKEFVEVGDDLMVLIHTTGHGKASGIKVENRVVHIWTFRDGKVTRLRVFLTKEEALAAMGLEAPCGDP